MWWWWCKCDDDDDDDDDDDVNVMMIMMIMMIMTLMKLANSATKFRHGMDKFYQPNSGLRGSRSGDEAIYTVDIYGILMFFVVPWFHPQMLPMTGLSEYPCNELMCSLCQAAPAHRWDLIIAPTNLSQAAGRRHIQSIHGLRPESVWARFPASC